MAVPDKKEERLLEKQKELSRVVNRLRESYETFLARFPNLRFEYRWSYRTLNWIFSPQTRIMLNCFTVELGNWEETFFLWLEISQYYLVSYQQSICTKRIHTFSQNNFLIAFKKPRNKLESRSCERAGCVFDYCERCFYCNSTRSSGWWSTL